jgi:sugar phosphate isomerase/epimerase
MPNASTRSTAARDFTVGLCYPTVVKADLIGLLDAAAGAGFDTVTVSPGLYGAARDGGRSDEALRAALRERGLAVAAIDPLISPLPALPPSERMTPFLRELLRYDEADCFAAAEALGAPRVAIAHPAGGEAPLEEMIDVIGGITTRAAGHGLGIVVEFIANSHGIGSLDVARAIVGGVGAANIGLVLDAWHLYRTGVDFDVLSELPAAEIGLVQVSDAPAAAFGVRPAVMEDRLLPGEGDMPLEQMIAALVGNRPGVDVGVEIFSSTLNALDPAEAGQRAGDAVRKVLAGVPS